MQKKFSHHSGHNGHSTIFAAAVAEVQGSTQYPQLHGKVMFNQKPQGVLVTAEVRGLPFSDVQCKNRIFGFHIHEGTSCTGDENNPFADAKGHFNPEGCPHPYHAGDLPPLFGNKGYAYMSVFTDRFRLHDVIGRVVIIHEQPDDFSTQPSGNAGKMIACGKIQLLRVR